MLSIFTSFVYLYKYNLYFLFSLYKMTDVSSCK